MTINLLRTSETETPFGRVLSEMGLRYSSDKQVRQILANFSVLFTFKLFLSSHIVIVYVCSIAGYVGFVVRFTDILCNLWPDCQCHSNGKFASFPPGETVFWNFPAPLPAMAKGEKGRCTD